MIYECFSKPKVKKTPQTVGDYRVDVNEKGQKVHSFICPTCWVKHNKLITKCDKCGQLLKFGKAEYYK